MVHEPGIRPKKRGTIRSKKVVPGHFLEKKKEKYEKRNCTYQIYKTVLRHSEFKVCFNGLVCFSWP